MKLFGTGKKRHSVPEGLFTPHEKVTKSIMKKGLQDINRTDTGEYKAIYITLESSMLQQNQKRDKM